METLIISLVSDQTLPNIQLIKEYRTQVTSYFFISTAKMEKQVQWICNTCNVFPGQASVLNVEEFSYADIQQKLDSFDYAPYRDIYVNITGGTKIMSLATFDYFKNAFMPGKRISILYLTGKKSEILTLHPDSRKAALGQEITLDEYLKAYGFTATKRKDSGIPPKDTLRFFDRFLDHDYGAYCDAWRFLRSKRDKIVRSEDFNAQIQLAPLLEELRFRPSQSGSLNKTETRYLTGDWFEEYISIRIKEDLDIDDGNMFVGTKLEKEIPPRKTLNQTSELLGQEPQNNQTSNEYDVLFVYDGTFYNIECKSSIISEDAQGKPSNILGETIYKADSLKTRFGLYAKTAIVTLTDFREYCASEDKNVHHNKIKNMEDLINRANLSNIKLIDKKMILSGIPLSQLIIR